MAHLVITIGCEYGAKGNQIGRKVAEDLGIKFYDRDTVDQIIKEVGIPKEIMEKVEEGVTIAGKGAEGDVRGSFFKICRSDRSCDACSENDYTKTFGQRILCDHWAISRLHFEGTSANSQSIYLFSK